jgi:hypothetical protein
MSSGELKAELVGGQGAFLLREKNCYRVKEEDWRKMKEQDEIEILAKTESRDGAEFDVIIWIEVDEGELSGFVEVEKGEEEVEVVASLNIKDAGGSLKMHHGGNDWWGVKVFEESYKVEEFIKNYAEDGFITVTVNLEISKKQESIKPAEEKQKDTITKDVARLFGDLRNSDYVVECQGQQFHSHRAVLAARSSTFASGLASNLVEGVQQKWVIWDAEAPAVEAMLAFMYTGNIPEAVQETPVELLGLATKYHLPELAEACREAVVAALTPNNAVTSLIQLDRYGIYI